MDNAPTWVELRKALRLVSHDVYVNRRITRERARLGGLKYFFTGEECSNQHISDRLVSNGLCVDCSKMKHFSDNRKKRQKERGS